MENMRKPLTAILLATLLTAPALAQEDYQNSYNYRMAEESLYSGDYKNATAYIDAEIEQHPQSACAYIFNGDLFRRIHASASAGLFYSTAMMVSEDDRTQVEDYGVAACLYADLLVNCLDKTDEAEAIIDAAVKKSPTTRMLIWQGWVAEENGHYDKAGKAFRAALKAHKKSAYSGYTLDDIYGYIIRSLLRAGNLTEAEKVIAEAEESCIFGALETKLCKVILLDMQGKDEEAVDLCLETAFRKRSDGKTLCDSEAGGSWIEKLEDLAFKNHDLVISKMEKFAEEKDASRNNVLWAAANYANDLNLGRDVIRLCKKFSPDNFESNPAVASAYSHIFANNKAVEVYDKAIEKYPDDKGLLEEKAMALASLGDIDAAEALLDTLIAADPANANAYCTRAKILLSYTPRHAEAAAYADSAVALSRSKTVIRMLCNHHLGDTGKAQADARAIIAEAGRQQASPKSAELTSLHMKSTPSPDVPYAYAVLGEKEKAIAALEKTLTPDVGLREAPFYERFVKAAKVYSILGMADETLASLGKALEAGYRDFTCLESSPFYDIVRGRKDYADLIDTYRAKYRQEIESLNN